MRLTIMTKGKDRLKQAIIEEDTAKNRNKKENSPKKSD